jgi:hypothetical protein
MLLSQPVMNYYDNRSGGQPKYLLQGSRRLKIGAQQGSPILMYLSLEIHN